MRRRLESGHCGRAGGGGGGGARLREHVVARRRLGAAARGLGGGLGLTRRLDLPVDQVRRHRAERGLRALPRPAGQRERALRVPLPGSARLEEVALDEVGHLAHLGLRRGELLARRHIRLDFSRRRRRRLHRRQQRRLVPNDRASVDGPAHHEVLRLLGGGRAGGGRGGRPRQLLRNGRAHVHVRSPARARGCSGGLRRGRLPLLAPLRLHLLEAPLVVPRVVARLDAPPRLLVADPVRWIQQIGDRRGRPLHPSHHRDGCSVCRLGLTVRASEARCSFPALRKRPSG